ncbi:MAG TPA: hypothetical protein DCF68_12480, partial [Cyanothece sp. UBA12306]|nr:hypothetical protein [Cyanothece sp. UBA12306]
KILLFLEVYKGCLELIYRFRSYNFSSLVFASLRKSESTKSPLLTRTILALDFQVSQCLTD